VCRSKHVEQLRNIGIINSTTRSHLVGYFYTIYNTRTYPLRCHTQRKIPWQTYSVYLRAIIRSA